MGERVNATAQERAREQNCTNDELLRHWGSPSLTETNPLNMMNWEMLFRLLGKRQIVAEMCALDNPVVAAKSSKLFGKQIASPFEADWISVFK